MNDQDLLVLKDHIVKKVRQRNMWNNEAKIKDGKPQKFNIQKIIDKIDKEIGQSVYLYFKNQNKYSLQTLNRKFLVPKTARVYQIDKGTQELRNMLGFN